jgi:lysophospholipase L1-like esterase
MSSPERLTFFLIGHNDLCPKGNKPIGTFTQEFYQSYGSALQNWDRTHKNSKAILISIIDISTVLTKLKNSSWSVDNNTKYSCKDSWEKIFPYCPAYSNLLNKNELQSYIEPRIKATNRFIKNLAEVFNTTSSSNAFYFIDVNPEIKKQLIPAHFSIDCFHPSAKGQSTLAQIIKDHLIEILGNNFLYH